MGGESAAHGIASMKAGDERLADVLFLAEDFARIREIAEELVSWDIETAGYCTAGTERIRHILKVANPPLYIVLRRADELPGSVFFRDLGDAGTPRYVPWGSDRRSHGEYSASDDHASSSNDEAQICLPDGTELEYPLLDLQPIGFSCSAGTGGIPAYAGSGPIEIPIRFSLRPADPVLYGDMPPPTLMLVGFDLLSRRLSESPPPENLLNGFSAAPIVLDGDRYLAILNDSRGATDNYLFSGDPEKGAFYRPYENAELFLPVGKILHPGLTSRTILRILNVHDGCAAVITSESGSPVVTEIPLEKFVPFRENYVRYFY